MPPTDEELLKRIAEGDQDAFLTLYDRFSPRVYGLIVKVMGRRSEADDVLQEVMWEAWNRAARYDPNLGSVATWLLLMARSRAIDAIRKARASADSAAERTRRQVASGFNGEEAAADLTEVSDPRLRSALTDLPAEQRVVIALAFLRGLTREQIAESLGIPVGTVKTRIRLGVKRLAEQQPQLGFTAT